MENSSVFASPNVFYCFSSFFRFLKLNLFVNELKLFTLPCFYFLPNLNEASDFVIPSFELTAESFV